MEICENVCVCVYSVVEKFSACSMPQIYLSDPNETTVALENIVLYSHHTHTHYVYNCICGWCRFSAFLFIIISTKNKIMSCRGTRTHHTFSKCNCWPFIFPSSSRILPSPSSLTLFFFFLWPPLFCSLAYHWSSCFFWLFVTWSNPWRLSIYWAITLAKFILPFSHQARDSADVYRDQFV